MSGSDGHGSIPRLEPEELRQRRAERDDVVVLDVRTADARSLHPVEIPGARWMPLAAVVQQAASLPRDGSIVTYCT